MKSAQTLIVVLLVLAVVLTLGLSIASRSITEVNVSSVEDESSKALDAAESGVEAALGSVATTGVPVQVGSTNSTYTVQTASIGNGGSVSPAEKMRSGDIITIYLSNHDAAGNFVLNDPAAYNKQINLCWGDVGPTPTPPTSQFTPALEARLYYYDSTAGYGVVGLAYDPNNVRRAGNNFAQVTSPGTNPCGADSRNYAFWVKNLGLVSNFSMPSTAKPLALRIRLLYNGDTGHYVGVEEVAGTGANNFPYQGISIVSSGASGATQRKLSVFQRFPDLPPIFDGPVYAGAGGLIK